MFRLQCSHLQVTCSVYLTTQSLYDVICNVETVRYPSTGDHMILCKEGTIRNLLYLQRRLCVCLFFILFHTIAFVSTKFGMLVEDLLEEFSDA
jgi:hypothetical protein